MLGSLTHAVSGRKVKPALPQHTLPFVDVSPLHADHHRHLDPEISHRRDHTLGQYVATQDATEDVNEHGTHLVVGQQDTEGVPDLFGVGTTTDI